MVGKVHAMDICPCNRLVYDYVISTGIVDALLEPPGRHLRQAFHDVGAWGYEPSMCIDARRGEKGEKVTSVLNYFRRSCPAHILVIQINASSCARPHIPDNGTISGYGVHDLLTSARPLILQRSLSPFPDSAGLVRVMAPVLLFFFFFFFSLLISWLSSSPDPVPGWEDDPEITTRYQCDMGPTDPPPPGCKRHSGFGIIVTARSYSQAISTWLPAFLIRRGTTLGSQPRL
jgi:hypothetical protein